jgi:hypothetical protein
MGPSLGGPRYDRFVALLNPTPDDKLVDARGRPYFLWDLEMTLEAFERALADDDPRTRAYFAAKLMRQAKPDDVFRFLRLEQIGALWSLVAPQLGNKREMGTWLLRSWKVIEGDDSEKSP